MVAEGSLPARPDPAQAPVPFLPDCETSRTLKRSGPFGVWVREAREKNMESGRAVGEEQGGAKGEKLVPGGRREELRELPTVLLTSKGVLRRMEKCYYFQ